MEPRRRNDVKSPGPSAEATVGRALVIGPYLRDRVLSTAANAGEGARRDPVTLRGNDTVGKAIGLMSTGGFRRLPIVDGEGKIQGVLKVSGILHYLVEHFPKVVYTLPPAPHHKTVTREGA